MTLESLSLFLQAAQEFDWFGWVYLPLLVFVARVADVTLMTMRIIFISRGKRKLAPVIGFVEVFIWIAVLGQIMQNIDRGTSFFAYAAGFAAGNYLGMLIEDRLAIGTLLIRVILPGDEDDLSSHLRSAGFGVTTVNGEGASGPVKLVYTIIDRKDTQQVMKIIHKMTPNAFVSIEEERTTEAGIFPRVSQSSIGSLFTRKSK